jgi:NTP pyrophosphatase (non-canonical NTP hydrolase)
MNFAEYQEAAWRTVNEAADIEIMAALGLSGESGEYAEHVKKARFHDHPDDNEAASKELGDVLWYLAVAAKHRGLSLETIALQNIAKLKARYGAKFDAAKSRERQDPDYDVTPQDVANGWTGFDKAKTNNEGKEMIDHVANVGIFGDSGT